VSEQFNFVSIKKKANIHFNGSSISHVLILKDGTKKTLGVILPSEHPSPLRLISKSALKLFQAHVQFKLELPLRSQHTAQANLLLFPPTVNLRSSLMAL